MACRGKLPGVSNACGAYLIDGNGTYRSLSGQPLGAALEGADASGGGLAIGSRLEAMWSQRGAEAWTVRPPSSSAAASRWPWT